jgi:hypothetical protein
MARLVTGRFEDVEQVKRALDAIAAAGFQRERYGAFYVAPPGQHDKFPLGGDARHDAGTANSAPGAAAGAAVGGGAGVALGTVAAIALPVAGFAAVLAGAGLGAYVGSLVGAMSQAERVPPAASTREEPAEQLGGMRIAVNVDGIDEARAISTLEAAGAKDIALAEGVWQKGEWKDFDPRVPPVTNSLG